MLRIPIFMAAAIVLAGTTAAQAQYYRTTEVDIAEESEIGDEMDRNALGIVNFNIGGAIAMPTGDSGSRLDPGGGFVAGLTVNPDPMFGIQGEYLFTYHDVEGDTLENATDLDGFQTLQYGNLNAVVRPTHGKRFGFYIIGGPGIYNRHLEVNRIEGVAATTYCDPWLFYCAPAAVPVTSVVGERDSFDFGVNGGFGAYAVLAPPLRMYLEARYHYIWGPDFNTPDGDTINADGQYIPLVLGLMF